MKFNRTRFFRAVFQVAVLGAVLGGFALLHHNYQYNAMRRNIGMGFGFLGNTAGFSISQTLIPYSETSNFGRTYLVGLLNTLLASGIGIFFATILGFVVGLMRLSSNWLVQKTALGYVELLRNIPPLLHVLFWYQVFFLQILPPFGNPVTFGNWGFVSIRGITIPEFIPTSSNGLFFLILFLGLMGIIGLWIAKSKLVKRGKHILVWPFQLAIVVILVFGVPLLRPFTLVMPVLGNFRFERGFTLRPELFSLVIAMATYTSSYIAEIVRSSILAVQKGQLEAARSLGFTRGQELRLVILPQAMRTMVPPLTNQYLNLTKNTSLGVAIAYPDLTAVFAGTALNQSGRALEIMLMVMTTYLTISLATSFLMNWYNSSIINKKGKIIRVNL